MNVGENGVIDLIQSDTVNNLIHSMSKVYVDKILTNNVVDTQHMDQDSLNNGNVRLGGRSHLVSKKISPKVVLLSSSMLAALLLGLISN